MVEPTEMSFGMQTRVDIRNHVVLDRGVHIGATWRIQPVRGDAAICQITAIICLRSTGQVTVAVTVTVVSCIAPPPTRRPTATAHHIVQILSYVT